MMQKIRSRPAPAKALRLPAAVVVAACLFAPLAGAQTPSGPRPAPGQPGQPGQSGQSANIPDQKLDAAAQALQKVVDIKRTYEQRIEAASEPERQTIVDEAKNALAKAVTDQGLSIEEYTAIIVIAQRDPEVREKILSRLPQGDEPPSGNPPNR
jgi:Spy/CpxP family protein refolding chaperone